MNNDLISRSALLREYGDFKDMGCPSGHTVTTDYMIELAEDAPAVDAEPVRHGRWTIRIDEYDFEFMVCSECGSEFYDGENDTVDTLHNYCPNCGAKMRGADDA